LILLRSEFRKQSLQSSIADLFFLLAHLNKVQFAIKKKSRRWRGPFFVTDGGLTSLILLCSEFRKQSLQSSIDGLFFSFARLSKLSSLLKRNPAGGGILSL
jgi:hypothetical protein